VRHTPEDLAAAAHEVAAHGPAQSAVLLRAVTVPVVRLLTAKVVWHCATLSMSFTLRT